MRGHQDDEKEMVQLREANAKQEARVHELQEQLRRQQEGAQSGSEVAKSLAQEQEARRKLELEVQTERSELGLLRKQVEEYKANLSVQQASDTALTSEKERLQRQVESAQSGAETQVGDLQRELERARKEGEEELARVRSEAEQRAQGLREKAQKTASELQQRLDEQKEQLGNQQSQQLQLLELGSNFQRQNKGGLSTLETNLANINVQKFDLQFDVDPLFSKTSAKFDQGGSKGLLQNNLEVGAV